MTQQSIKMFINETYSKPPKRNYITNKHMFVLLMKIGV